MAGSGDWVDAEPGVRRRVLRAQGRLMLMEVRFAAGAAGYEHSHPHEQISYCIAGRFEYSLDGRTHLLAEGESIYVRSCRTDTRTAMSTSWGSPSGRRTAPSRRRMRWKSIGA